jgi:hypothetical protein
MTDVRRGAEKRGDGKTRGSEKRRWKEAVERGGGKRRWKEAVDASFGKIAGRVAIDWVFRGDWQ